MTTSSFVGIIFDEYLRNGDVYNGDWPQTRLNPLPPLSAKEQEDRNNNYNATAA
jgi:hypothetical protein